MKWPNRTEQRGLILLLAALVALAVGRACSDRRTQASGLPSTPTATATCRA